MAFDDQLDDQANGQPNDDYERQLKRLSLIVGSSIKPFSRRAATGAPEEQFAEPAATPSAGEGLFGRSVRPRLPAPTSLPLTTPTIPSPDAPPSILGAAPGSVLPAPKRPTAYENYQALSGQQPKREDFKQYDLPTWKKVLGTGLGFALGSPQLVSSSLNRPEMKFERAQGEYQQRLGQAKTAADEERAQAEEQRKQQLPTKPEKPENLDREAYDFYIQGGMSPAEARKQVLKDAANAKPEKPDTATEEDQRYENIQAALNQKKSVSTEDSAWAKAYEKRKTLGPALTAGAKAGEQGTQRSDRSYQFTSNRIDALRKPVEDRAERIARLSDTLSQGTPQADALVAPELLSVMAGGAGSGLRMNEAEIARIVGGRTNWESIKAKVNAWQLDPNKGFALTPAQREQTRALFASVKDRVSRKMQVIDEESQNLLNSDDPKDHRRIYQQLQKRLSDIDTASGAGGGPASGGKAYTQADVDAAARQYGKTAQEIEAAFQAKGWNKKQ